MLFAASSARYLPTGHLIYWQGRNLFAVPFNLEKLAVTGGAVSVLEGAWTGAISDSGTLIYVRQPSGAPESRAGTGPRRTLVWVDRKGREEPLNAPPNIYRYPKISPDGTKVALTVHSDRTDIWIWDLVRKISAPLTFEGAFNTYPVWTPDGKQIIFSSSGREGAAAFGGIYMKASDGTGEVKRVFMLPDRFFMPFSLSSDGKALVGAETMNAQTPQTYDVAMVSMERDHEHKPLVHEKHYESQPQVSPDGRFIAYTSDGSGQNEIYVCPFPDVNKGRWRVSADGGESPLWSPDNREIFYWSRDVVMAVSVGTNPNFNLTGTPRTLFRGTYLHQGSIWEGTPWDISPDAKRFLMLKLPQAAGEASTKSLPRQEIHIVVNWFEELKQRVPANK